jgi:hypothetical protein
MRRPFRPVLPLLLAAVAGFPLIAPAQAISRYSLRLGPEVRSGSLGGGLSLEAGDRWFARLGVGTLPAAGLAGAFDHERLSVGAGYRFNAGESLSMQLLRGRTTDRLGLAVRYDWTSYYLRLSYDRRWSDTTPERLRFSAGVRF